MLANGGEAVGGEAVGGEAEVDGGGGVVGIVSTKLVISSYIHRL